MDSKEIISQLTRKSYELLKGNSEYLIRINRQGNAKENPLLEIANESKQIIAEAYSYLLNLDLDHLCELDVQNAMEKYKAAEKSFYEFKKIYLSIQ